MHTTLDAHRQLFNRANSRRIDVKSGFLRAFIKHSQNRTKHIGRDRLPAERELGRRAKARELPNSACRKILDRVFDARRILDEHIKASGHLYTDEATNIL
jgi:hypothetical protein